MASEDQTPSPSKTAYESLPSEMYRSGMKVTLIGMVVNVLLIFLKFAGGIFGSSKAMIADAVHSVSDFITDFGVLVGLRFISKPADSKHPYGHGRLETAISLLMGLFIIITGIGILKNASYSIILSWRNIFPKMPGTIALLTGIISIICKEGLYQYTSSVARKTGSSTLKANAWHHRSDALSSVATVIGIGGAILLGDRWTVLDPLAAVFVSGLVIKIGVEIGWNALRELSDEALSNERQQKLHTVINTVEGVHGCHHLRTRSLGRYVTVDAHILVDPEMSVRDSHIIATDTENAVRNALGNAAFVTIHVEPGKRG